MRRTLWDPAKPEESCAMRGRSGKLLNLLAFCNQFISLYTIAATVFSQIPAGYQLVMAGTLQLIKIWVKQTEWTKAQLHWSRNDLATLHVATNSQLFHQLFIAACFQTSKSVLTLVLIVVLGIGQDIVAIRAIQRRMNALNHIRLSFTKPNHASKASMETLRSLILAWRALTALND